METSLRYAGDSKALRIHAKQKIPIVSKTHLQVHGELDTRIGTPSYFCALIRQFFPDISSSLGVGVHYNKYEKLRLTARGKKSFPVATTNYGSLDFNIKGRCHTDKEFKKTKSTGAIEFSWSMLDFQKEQDVRLKLGFEVLDKVAYMQIRENNWTFNVDANRKWNLRFDL